MLACEPTRSGHDHRDHAGSGHPRTLTIEPFEPWHFIVMAVQPTQAAMRPFLTLDYGRALQGAGDCFTAFAGTTVIACAGVARCWPGRAHVWSLLSASLPEYGPLVHRAVLRYLRRCPIRRLELTVDPTHDKAVAWATRLGFTYESTMPAYGMNGELQDMYVRILKG